MKAHEMHSRSGAALTAPGPFVVVVAIAVTALLDSFSFLLSLFVFVALLRRLFIVVVLGPDRHKPNTYLKSQDSKSLLTSDQFRCR